MALSFQEITARHGSEHGFFDWLDAQKKVQEIRRLELANSETEGRLIDRALVCNHVFGSIDATNRRLLGDVPKNLARRIAAMTRSGATHEEMETAIRRHLEAELAAMKASASRALRGHARKQKGDDQK